MRLRMVRPGYAAPLEWDVAVALVAALWPTSPYARVAACWPVLGPLLGAVAAVVVAAASVGWWGMVVAVVCAICSVIAAVLRLRQHFDVDDNPADTVLAKPELIARLQGKQGALTTGSERIDAELLAA